MHSRIEELETKAAPSHAIADHIHAQLTIRIEDDDVFIPANIGLGDGHYNPHTHAVTHDPSEGHVADEENVSDGILHIGEGGPAGISGQFRYVTLDDFFDVWRVAGSATDGKNADAFFSETSIMGHDVDAYHELDFLVNGSPSNEYENYIPHDGDEILIHLRRTGWAWQNINMPNDVSDDGQVVPRDALLVINELIKNGSHEVDKSTQPEYYFDVSGDGFVSPIDALRVINELL
ncbi:MAG: hypothetical protein KDB27_07040 [Planctomycetales bacterium]|nr:hypothetical protein [Planctomycetales bacterium]